MKTFYLVFALAIVFDWIVLPLLGAVPWFPSFFLATLPFLFLFSSRRVLTIISFSAIIFLWLVSGVNLGVIVASVGIMVFFERWVLLQFFQYETWQILVFTAISPLIFGVLVAVLDGLILGQAGFVSFSFFLKVVFSAFLAVGVNFVLRRMVRDQTYEKKSL